MAILPKRSSSKLLHCEVQGQRKNEASVHGTAKEFAVNSLACPRVVSISNSTLKGQTRGMLGNATVYAVANLCQSILTIEFLNE